MRQQVAQHEVLAEVPGRGRLLELESALQRHFFNRLAAGQLHSSEAGTVIDWRVDGHLSASDERSAAEDELHRGLDRVDSIRAMIEDRLRGVRDESLYLRVPVELVRALGGRVDPAVPTGMRASELQLHLNTLEAAQRGVRHALKAGVFGAVEGRGLLVGWCLFSTRDEEPTPARVGLQDVGEAERDGVTCHRLSWSLSAVGRRIELRFVDAPEGTVPGTATELHGYRTEGEWCIPSSVLAGRQVEALAEIGGVEHASEERLSFPVVSSEPEPIPVAPPIDLEPEADETPAEPDDEVPIPPAPVPVTTKDSGCWPQVWRWLGVLLLVALLLFLLLTLLGRCEGCLHDSVTIAPSPTGVDDGGAEDGPGLDAPGPGEVDEAEPGLESGPQPAVDADELPRVEFTPFGVAAPAAGVGGDAR